MLNNHTIDFFDIEWNRLKLKGQYRNSNTEIDKPIELKKMMEIEKNLSKEFPHVRVDFYLIENEVKIGGVDIFRW